MTNDSEVIMRQPTYVPTGWLVAIIGAAATAIVLSASAAVAWASLSSRVTVVEGEVVRYADMGERVVRVETILVYKFPKEAEEADRQIATQRRNK